ncbi:MAG: four helix bundle protein [Bdellovibrionales bacterium]|nr:four helix bundle protein [Bdellovibrionales bacterium]
MSRYKHLPIYKLTYELLERIHRVTKDFPREYKFTLAQNLQQEVIELVVLIYKANASAQKIPVIETMLERLQVVELLVRLAHDLKILSLKNYASLVEMTESISRQSMGWKKSLTRAK